MLNPGERDKIAPSTSYVVEGNPDDYRFVLRGADLVLIDANNHEKVFLFVGNIMSLNGEVHMEFTGGKSLSSEDLFNRSEMEDMDQLDDESTEWEVPSLGMVPPEDAIGNTEDGTGLLPPSEQDEEVPAQAPEEYDPTNDLLELQRQLLNKMSEKGEDQFQKGGGDIPNKTGGSDGQSSKNPEGEKGNEDKDGPVEILPPAERPTIKLLSASDTGMKEGQHTKELTPEFEGYVNPNSLVSIFVDGSLSATATSDESGYYKVSVTLLDDDVYEVLAYSPYNGVPVSSVPLEITIDNVALDLPTLELLSDTSTIPGSGPHTNDNTPTLGGSNGEAGSLFTLEVSKDGGVWEVLKDEITVDEAGTWSYTVGAMPDGSEITDAQYSFRISGEDRAGNAASHLVELNDVTVKTTRPTTTNLQLSPDSDSRDADAGGILGDRRTNAETLVLTVDACADTASVEFFISENNIFVSMGQAVEDGGQWVFTVPNSRVSADGDYLFQAKATDVAGNVEDFKAGGLTVVVDRTPELAPTMDLDASSDSFDEDGLLGTDSDDYTNADLLVLTGTAERADSSSKADIPIDIYLIVDDGAETLISDGEVKTLSDGTWTYTFDSSTHGIASTQKLEFIARVRDAADNVVETDLTVMVDRADPDAPSIGLANMQGFLNHGIDKDEVTVKNSEAVLEGLISESSADVILTLYKVNADGSREAIANNMAANGALGDITVSDNGDGTYSWSYDYGTLVHGTTHTFVATTEDKAGNKSGDSKEFVIHADSQISAPSISLDGSTNTAGGPSGTDSDNITAYVDTGDGKHFKLNVSADADSTITVYLEGATLPGAVEIVPGRFGVQVGISERDSNGDWPLVSFDASEWGYDNDTNDLTFIAVTEDVATNSDHTVFTMTLDDEAPIAGAIDLAESDDHGEDPADNTTNAKEIRLSGSLAEGDSDVKVIVKDGGVELGEATVVSDGSGGYEWYFDIGDEGSASAADHVAEGTHSYTAEVQDNAGNTTTLNALEVIVDRTISDPTFALSSGPGSSDTGRVDDDRETNATELVFNGTSDLGDRVEVYLVNASGPDVFVDDFEAAATSWDVTVPNSFINANGDYSFYITTTDLAGNTKTTSATPVEVTIDRSFNTPGDIDLDAGSDTSYADGAFTGGTTDDDDITSAESIVLKGVVSATGVEPGSEVFLYIDGVAAPIASVETAAGDTEWSITVPNGKIPADGDYTFYIKYKDLAGNLSDSSTDFTVTIDRTAPGNPTIALDGTENVDYFVHGGNVYTDENAPTFTISDLEVGTTLNIKVDGVAVLTHAVTADSFTFDPTDFAGNGTDDGLHTVTVVAVDAAGNASDTASYSFTLDTQAEPITGVLLDDPSNSSDGKPANADDTITNVTTPTIVGEAEANSTVVVTIQDASGNDIDSETVQADASGKWSACPITDGSLLTDGNTYTVVVAATDYAGNVANDSSYSFTIDTSIDAVNFAMVETADNDTGFALDDQYTANRNPEFTWDAQEALTAKITIERADGTPVKVYENIDSPAGIQTWAVPDIDPLPDGDYVVKAEFLDVAGNSVVTDGSGNPVTYSVPVTVDNSPPSLSVELADSSDSGADNDWLTNNEMVAAGLELAGSAEAGSRLYVYVNDMDNPIAVGADDYLTVGAGGSWTFDLSALDMGSGIHEGDNLIKVVAMDAAGNKTPLSKTLKVDSEVDPVGGFFLHTDSDSGIKNDFITNDKTPLLLGNTERGATVQISVIVGGTETALGDATVNTDGSWTYQVESGVLTDDGGYTFKATITDKAANVDTVEQVITLDSDPTAPSVVMTDDTAGVFFGTDSDFITSDTTPVFTVTTEVDTQLQIYQDGVLKHTVARLDNTGTGELVYSADTLTEGSYEFRFVSTDSAGNTSETVQDVVIDPQYIDTSLTVALHTDYDTGESNSDGLTNESRPVFTGVAEEGSRLRMYLSAKCDTEADALAAPLGAVHVSQKTLGSGETTWDYTSSNLTDDGFYKFTVIAEDEAGNTVTKHTVFELDTTPPEVPTFGLTDDAGNPIVPSTQTTDNTPGLSGTAEAGSKVSIAIVNSATGEQSHAFEVEADGSDNWFYQVPSANSLNDGSYDVVITSTDKAGNSSESTAGFQITGETPVAPTIALHVDDDTNITTDGVTKLNTDLTLTGVAQSHCNVMIYKTIASDTGKTGGTLEMTVEAGANGIWEATLPDTFADDTYYYYAKSVYSGGVEYTSDLFALTVDTVTINPTLELVDDTSLGNEWFTNPADNDTATDWETSNGVITGIVDEGSTVRIKATNVATGVETPVTIDPSNLTDTAGGWTYSYDLSTLGDGEYTIEVTTTDLAGNVGTGPVQTVKLDTALVKPTVDLDNSLDTQLNVTAGGEILFPDGTDAGRAMLDHLPAGFISNDTDGYTRNHTFPLNGTAEVGSQVRIAIYKGVELHDTVTYTVTDPSGNWTHDLVGLEDGQYTFNVTSVDTAGNEQQADPLSIYVDAAPSQSCYIDMHSDNEHPNQTADTTPGFTLRGDSGSIWLLYLDDGTEPVATGTFTETGWVYYYPTDLEPNAPHEYRLVTVDRAGNVQTAPVFNFTIDTIAPEQQPDPVSVTGTSTVVAATAAEPMAIYSNDNNPTITLKVEPGTYAYLDGLGPDEWLHDADGDGVITYTLPTGASQGEHSVTVRFRDAVHNHDANEDLTFNLVVDSTRPFTKIELDEASDLGFSNTDMLTSGDQLVLTGRISELGLGQDPTDFSSDIKDYSVEITNNTSGVTTTIDAAGITIDADGKWTLVYGTDGVDLDSGDYTATLTASDLAGNIHSSNVDFTIDNSVMATPEASFDRIGTSDFFVLELDGYLPAGADTNDYKYELTFYGEDASGNQISMTKPLSPFTTDGSITELVTPSIMNTYDHAGLKVVDRAGNESQADFIDFDKSDVTFVAEVETTADVASLDVTIAGDTDGDGVFDDVNISGNALVNVADGSWSFNFAALGEGDYKLSLEGLDSGNASVSGGVESTYDFSVLAGEMQSDQQDFSIGEADASSGGGADPGGGAAGGDTTSIEANVHIDHVEGSIV